MAVTVINQSGHRDRLVASSGARPHWKGRNVEALSCAEEARLRMISAPIGKISNELYSESSSPIYGSSSGSSLEVVHYAKGDDDYAHLFPGFVEIEEELIPATDARTCEAVEKEGYTFVKEIGRGGQGVVYLVMDSEGKENALKMITTEMALYQKLNAISHSDKRGESLALSLPTHKNLMQTEGIFTYDTTTGSYQYQTDRSECSPNEVVVGILMEYVPDSQELYDFIVKGGPISKESMKKIGLQIAMGLAAMHEQKIFHRDLKLENILIDKDEQIKILDFGMLRYLEEATDRTFTACGTPSFVAPEVIKREGYDRLVDSWSYGTALFSLAFKDFAFRGRDPSETLGIHYKICRVWRGNS